MIKSLDTSHATLYCDGSSSLNWERNHVGGWAFHLENVSPSPIIKTGIEKHCNSNRAELLAIVHGLQELAQKDSDCVAAHVFSDSQFAIERFRDARRKKPRYDFNENEDLRKLFLAYNDQLDITLCKEDRNSIPEMHTCDRLAGLTARQLIPGGYIDHINNLDEIIADAERRDREYPRR